MSKATRPGRPAWQALALAVFLIVVAVLVYGGQVRDGGLIGDAWVTRAWYVLYPHANFFDTVGHFLDLDSMAPRPGNAIYRVALNEWFGADTSAWLAWQLVSCVCMCLALFVLMHELGLRFLDAAAVSTLLLVFPASASLWLWSPVVHASLAISLGAVGFLLGLRAFHAQGAKRWVLHGASLLLFVLSLLLYEICLPLFLASVLLYGLQAPRRAAVARWLVDCLVLLPLALAVSGSTEAQNQGVGGAISHAGDMAAQLPSLLFGTLLPLDSVEALATVALVLVYVLGAMVMRSLSPADPLRARLRLLYAMTAAGLIVVVLGYSIYVPGLEYYMPLASGIGNRVNTVAAIGWVLFLYALLALVMTLVGSALRVAPLYATLATVALAVGLGVSWLSPIADESKAYVAAHEESDRVLDVIKRAVPHPPKGSAIWLFGQPVEISPGVPVFANYWNTSAAVGLAYHDRAVVGYVAFPGTTFECRTEGVVPGGHFEYPPPPPGELGRFGSRYGRTYFVDTVQGQFATVDTRQRCEELRDAFPRSPQLPRPS
jgi:hypothetical protein